MTAQIPVGQIQWLVNRQHVGTSEGDIVRMLRRRMTASGWTKDRRKEAYRLAIAIHRDNRTLYRAVQAGSLS